MTDYTGFNHDAVNGGGTTDGADVSNLKKLGGLEAAKTLTDLRDIGNALIERVKYLTAERDELKKCVKELEAKRRTIMCIWCGSTITASSDHRKTISDCQAHDQMCEANPMVSKLQAAKKRVEELERELDTFVPELQEANRTYGKQLQAARELAEIVSCDARVHASIRAMARDFLKMLDSPAPEPTPPNAT